MPYKSIEEKRQHDREYYLLNKEKINNRSIDRRKIFTTYDKEYHKKYDILYRESNRDKINEQQRKRHKNRYKIDLWYRLAHSLRARLYKVCNIKWCSKQNKTLEYVWCTKEFLVKHIESQFLEWMSWDNRNEWHIDHIIPISSFNLEIESEIYKAMNFTNLQPLWATDNVKKSNRIT